MRRLVGSVLVVLAACTGGCGPATVPVDEVPVDEVPAPAAAEPAERWAAGAVAVIEAEVAAGHEGVAEALAYAAPDVVYDDRALSGALVHGRQRLTGQLARAYGPALDEVALQAVHVDTGGALVQLHFGHATGLRGPADVLQRRVYGAEGVVYARNDVAVATLRRRASGVAAEAFAPWEALAGAYAAAWSGDDPAAAGRLYAPDARVVDSVAGIDVAGRAAVEEHAARLAREGGQAVVLAPVPGGSEPALYLDDRLPQLAAGVGLVVEVIDARGCRSTVAVHLLVSDGEITAERRFHEVASARRCLAGPPGGWWDAPGRVAPEAARPVTSVVRVAGRAVEIRGSTPALDGLLRWALERFADAGLEPPPLSSVTFAGATGRCAGVAGRARRHAGGTDLTLCFDDAAACADASCSGFTLAARLTVLHELAHAWEHAFVDEPVRAAYLRVADLTSWNDPDVPWGERGVERAAETLMWGLMDERVPLPRIGDPPCETLSRDYELLAGTRAPWRCS